MAVNHPFVYRLSHPEGDYFTTHEYPEEYIFSRQNVVLSHWHRPLQAVTGGSGSP